MELDSQGGEHIRSLYLATVITTVWRVWMEQVPCFKSPTLLFVFWLHIIYNLDFFLSSDLERFLFMCTTDLSTYFRLNPSWKKLQFTQTVSENIF